jgi:hypothetical protein
MEPSNEKNRKGGKYYCFAATATTEVTAKTGFGKQLRIRAMSLR